MSTRKSYTIDYKIKVVEEARGKKLSSFCKEKGLTERQFRKWRCEYNKHRILQEYKLGKKRSCGSGRVPEYPELENLLFDWIVDRRLENLVVRRVDVHNMALFLAAELEIPSEKFKASQRWVDLFLSRHHLSLRRSTTLFKLEDDQIVLRALSYKSFIDSIDFSQYNLSNMVAMDETAVYFGEKSQTTIASTGSTSIYVPSTGYESYRVTCILAVRFDKTKVVPLLINKGKKEKIELISGVHVIESSKAWATQSVIRKWIASTLPRLFRGRARGLLVWDSASTHRALQMKQFLAQQRIDQVMIPAGTTGYLQSLDIAVNKPFKDYLREEINDYIEHRMQRNARGNVIKPCIQEVVSWVKNAWDKISEETVANALRASYLDKKFGFEESCIAKHERLGPLILEKLQSGDINNNNNLNIYEDVMEEDEIAVSE